MRVLVCGSRTWEDKGPIDTILDGLDADSSSWNEPFVVIQGGANGADRLAAAWAHQSGMTNEQYNADWANHGKAAGPIRNTMMLVLGKPDLVVAFSEQPITSGTQNMVDQAKAAGVPVWVVSHG